MEKEVEQALNTEGFTVISEIGRGGFAKVYKVTWDRYPLFEFAAKVFKCVNQRDRDIYGSYVKEITSLKFLDHPNIIKCFKFFEFLDYCVLIFEYCHGGSLHQLIKDQRPLKEKEFIPIAKQCLDALNACHTMNITHRDIKPGNILLDMNNRVKLCDFGLASYITKGQKIHGFTGSLAFLPPEVLRARLYDPVKADIWGLGVTFCYFLTGRIPWNSNSDDSLTNAICNLDPEFPCGISQELKCVLDRMLIKKPECRPSANNLMSLSIFKTNRMTRPRATSIITDVKKSSSYLVFRNLSHRKLSMKGTISYSNSFASEVAKS